MKLYALHCEFCKKTVNRSKRRVNESKKLNWKTYCSSTCESNCKNRQQTCKCANPKCNRKFKRLQNQLGIGKSFYCSHSCAASVNNSKFPKRHSVIKICPICNKRFVEREKYCSLKCKNKDQIINHEMIISRIKDFCEEKGRIPLKREFNHSKVAQRRFGSWNKAIEAAGFEPNPIMFAKKYTANDGHKCDSLSEKIIDDWMFERKINHIRNYPYPGNFGFTADFVVGNTWIEFFGLHGASNTYDLLRLKKLRLTKQNRIKLIEIFPKDLFPQNKLYEILKI